MDGGNSCFGLLLFDLFKFINSYLNCGIGCKWMKILKSDHNYAYSIADNNEHKKYSVLKNKS